MQATRTSSSWGRTFIATCAIGILLLGITHLMADSAELMPPDIRRILERGELVIALQEQDGPPFYAEDENGVLIGLDIDVAQGMAETLGVAVRFDRKATTFDGLINVVASGDADLAIAYVSRTPRRATRVNFSQPYVKLHHALLLNRIMAQRTGGNRPIAEWLNQPGVKLGTIAGSSYMYFTAKDYPEATLIGFDTFDEAAAATVRGELHAAIFDDSLISLWVADHPEESIYVQRRILYDKEDPISVVVNWRDGHLLNWVETYLKTLEADGSLPALRRKWLGENR